MLPKEFVIALPTLVVITGPPGAGKTTLAHAFAHAVGCPAVCRDEIKEGMARTEPTATPGPADDLSRRTLPVFFDVLATLLTAGVTTVAEAAFQDRLWRPELDRLRPLARLAIVRCQVDPEVAHARTRQRPGHLLVHGDAPKATTFEHVRIAPAVVVDTTDGYRPGLAEIIRAAGLSTPAPPAPA